MDHKLSKMYEILLLSRGKKIRSIRKCGVNWNVNVNGEL